MKFLVRGNPGSGYVGHLKDTPETFSQWPIVWFAREVLPFIPLWWHSARKQLEFDNPGNVPVGDADSRRWCMLKMGGRKDSKEKSLGDKYNFQW
jgi:hypothetical protein